MKSMNRVFLMGHLGAEPQLAESKNGRAYTRLSVATNRTWIEGEERKEHTDWHSVFVFGRLAQTCTEQLGKGALVFVEGTLHYWKSSEGKIHNQSIQAETVHFLNTRKGLYRGEMDQLDNSVDPRNHNAVAHPAM